MFWGQWLSLPKSNIQDDLTLTAKNRTVRARRSIDQTIVNKPHDLSSLPSAQSFCPSHCLHGAMHCPFVQRYQSDGQSKNMDQTHLIEWMIHSPSIPKGGIEKLLWSVSSQPCWPCDVKQSARLNSVWLKTLRISKNDSKLISSHTCFSTRVVFYCGTFAGPLCCWTMSPLWSGW